MVMAKAIEHAFWAKEVESALKIELALENMGKKHPFRC